MEKHVAIIGDHEYRFEQTEGGYTVCVSGESSSGFSICLRIFSHKKRKMAMAYWRGITAAGSFMGNLSYPGDNADMHAPSPCNSDDAPDMSHVDLSGIDLRDADLSRPGLDLNNPSLRDAAENFRKAVGKAMCGNKCADLRDPYSQDDYVESYSDFVDSHQ